MAFPAFPPGREWSRIFSTSTTESTICGSEVWRRGTTGTQSTICSTVRRKTRSCGPDTADSRSGRDPEASTSSTSKGKVLGACRLGGWDAPERGRVVLLVPTPQPLLPSVSVGLSGAYTRQGPCGRSAVHERSRRSLRRCAAPITGCQLVSAMNNRSTVHKGQRATCLRLVVVFDTS